MQKAPRGYYVPLGASLLFSSSIAKKRGKAVARKSRKWHKACAVCNSLTTRTQNSFGAIYPLCEKCPPPKTGVTPQLVYQMSLTHRNGLNGAAEAFPPANEISSVGAQPPSKGYTGEQICLF